MQDGLVYMIVYMDQILFLRLKVQSKVKPITQSEEKKLLNILENFWIDIFLLRIEVGKI